MWGTPLFSPLVGQVTGHSGSLVPIGWDSPDCKDCRSSMTVPGAWHVPGSKGIHRVWHQTKRSQTTGGVLQQNSVLTRATQNSLCSLYADAGEGYSNGKMTQPGMHHPQERRGDSDYINSWWYFFCPADRWGHPLGCHPGLTSQLSNGQSILPTPWIHLRLSTEATET